MFMPSFLFKTLPTILDLSLSRIFTFFADASEKSSLDIRLSE
jgi:hypothetical protein